MVDSQEATAAVSAAPVSIADAVKAVAKFDELRKDPVLACLLPAAKVVADLVGQKDGLTAAVEKLSGELQELQKSRARALADATDYKQDAVDEIGRREREHRAQCETMTTKAQHEVSVLETEKQRLSAELKELREQHADQLVSMDAQRRDAQTALDQTTARMAEAKRKLAELLATDEAPAAPAPVDSASTAGTTGDNVAASQTTGGN